jgi:hypothetical protein
MAKKSAGGCEYSIYQIEFEALCQSIREFVWSNHGFINRDIFLRHSKGSSRKAIANQA